VNYKAKLTARNIAKSVLSVLLITAVAYGFMSWLQGRK